MDLQAGSDASAGPFTTGLIPIFAFTRLIKSWLHRPTARVETSPAVFPTFELEELRYIVSFGDSYSSTLFDRHGKQPSPEAPLGNPPYPGFTTAKGPNWIDYLTVQYNQSYIETINFAFPGARFDSDIIGPSIAASMNWQLNDLFLPKYGTIPPPSLFPWTPSSTLFTIWFGVNDVGAVWRKPDYPSIFDRVFASYAAKLDVLYATGARNFLLLNLVPIYRHPLVHEPPVKTTAELETQARAVHDWNGRIIRLVENFSTVYPSARAGIIDTFSLFDAAQDNPCINPLTCPIRETDTYCQPHVGDGPKLYGETDACKYDVDQYFWADMAHPAWRVHMMLADAIARALWKMDD